MALEDLSNEEIESLLDDLQRRLERLRVLYEQFFLGIEKTPPYNVQKDVVRILHRMTHVRITQTTLKYRLQSIQQRFSSHKAYWSRTVRDIEEGRFKRVGARARPHAAPDDLTVADLAAVAAIRDSQGDAAAAQALERRRAAKQAEVDAAADFLRQLEGGEPERRTSMPPPVRKRQPTPGEVFTMELDAEPQPAPGVASEGPRGVSADEIALRAQKLRELRERMARGPAGAAPQAGAAAQPIPSSGPTAPSRSAEPPSARPAAPAVAPPRPVPPPAADPARMVFDRLVATKRQLNEPTEGLTYDAVRRSMDKQVESLREKRGARSVDFDVVVKDGKAFLKPIVRE